MVTKDWKRTKPKDKESGDIMQWENKKENGTIWIQEILESGVYYVNVVYHESGMWKSGENKRFTNKQEAIKFAEKYMRTH